MLIDFFKDLIEENKEVGGTWTPIEIVDFSDIPKTAQREDLINCSYDHKFVIQYGPDLCDSYHGFIWYPLGDSLYLKAEFYI